MLGLAEQVGGDPVRMRRFVGDDEDFGGPGDGVDANATLRGGTSTLLFNDDAIVAVVANNEIIDSTATLDGAPGRSWALNPQKISALGNDEGSAWCLSTQPLNEFIDAGSPGLANETCP